MNRLQDRLQDEGLVSCGRLFFAISMSASGIQQLVTGHFVRLVPPLPAWLPWHSFWAYLVGLVLIAAGVAIVEGRLARLAAATLGALILLAFFTLNLPLAATNPMAGFMWTNPLKALAMFGGVLTLAATLPEEPAGRFSGLANLGERLKPLGPVLFGLFLFIGGVQHFVYRAFVAQLVPRWVPRPEFWVYFTGTALIAAGLGINIRKTARLAATLSGIMIFLWVVLLHIPRALSDLHNAGETSAIFEALALSGVAFMLAGQSGPAGSWRRHR